MRVLRVGAGLAVKVQNRVPVEHNILDAARVQAVPNERANANLARDLIAEIVNIFEARDAEQDK